MKFRLQAVLLTILIIGAGLATQLPVKSWADKTGLKTVASVDLSRYMGKWYEIAAIPMYFERNCHGETTAEYTLLPDGLVKVVNSCDTASHKRIAAEGRAKVTDAKTNARLKVTFLNWFGWRWFAGGDYWITDLARDYSYVLIGHPSRKYAWILSRTPSLPNETLEALSVKLKAQGYNPCDLVSQKQAGGIQGRFSLCVLTGQH